MNCIANRFFVTRWLVMANQRRLNWIANWMTIHQNGPMWLVISNLRGHTDGMGTALISIFIIRNKFRKKNTEKRVIKCNLARKIMTASFKIDR